MEEFKEIETPMLSKIEEINSEITVVMSDIISMEFFNILEVKETLAENGYKMLNGNAAEKELRKTIEQKGEGYKILFELTDENTMNEFMVLFTDEKSQTKGSVSTSLREAFLRVDPKLSKDEASKKAEYIWAKYASAALEEQVRRTEGKIIVVPAPKVAQLQETMEGLLEVVKEKDSSSKLYHADGGIDADVFIYGLLFNYSTFSNHYSNICGEIAKLDKANSDEIIEWANILKNPKTPAEEREKIGKAVIAKAEECGYNLKGYAEKQLEARNKNVAKTAETLKAKTKKFTAELTGTNDVKKTLQASGAEVTKSATCFIETMLCIKNKETFVQKTDKKTNEQMMTR